MIAIDTSALAAIAFDEPEADTFVDALDRAGDLLIGAPTLFELRMVLVGRLGSAHATDAFACLVPTRARTVAFDDAHRRAADAAFVGYGKGRHRASLNFGDCMAYAVAAVAGCPLLYKGWDFAATDVRSALAG